MHPSDSRTDTDHALLEGLLQLAVEGQTDDQDFQRIGEEVYSRLLDTYGQTIRPPPPVGGRAGGPPPLAPQRPNPNVGFDSCARKWPKMAGCMASMKITPNAAPARCALWLMRSPPRLSIQML